jgi:hypothetical protein
VNVGPYGAVVLRHFDIVQATLYEVDALTQRVLLMTKQPPLRV